MFPSISKYSRADARVPVVVLFVVISCIVIGLPSLVVASAGDRSWTFNKCLKECFTANCSSAGAVLKIPVHLAMFGWDCTGECKYICMWKTVDDFQKDGSRVPQFYGKWPFIRLFGIQEPASAFFSLLNGIAHLVMLRYFRYRVPSIAPMYRIWHGYALVALNAWFFSIVFHVRDTNLTEMLDYFSAILLVLYSLFALIIRLQVGTQRKFLTGCVTAAAFLSYYCYHVYYLAFVKFDYGYNMKANVIVGSVNAAGWLLWAKRVWRKQTYVWKGVVSVVSVMLLLLLEVGDFPPLFWVLDAHALWHAGTAPLAFLWYRFLTEDCIYMLESDVDKRYLLLQKEKEKGV